MEKKLTNNLSLKILSVFLAFFVWLAVMNISNPEVTDTQEVTLEVLNDKVLADSKKTYEIMSSKKTVTVAYKVRALDEGSISASDFRAYIDLADMYEPTGAVPVIVETKNNKVNSVVSKPGVIRVETEDLQRKTFDLVVYLDGKTESGYKEGSASLSSTYVYVEGPVSLVGQISTVGIVVDIDGVNSDVSGTATIQCFDANKNQLPADDRLNLSRSEVDYSIPVLKIKNLALSFEPEGTVAEGYKYTGIEASKNMIEVVGLKSDLADVNSITIPGSVLDIEGASGDREATINLNDYLPSGVSLADSAASEIKVIMKVEPLEIRNFELSTDKIRQTGGSDQYEYQYDQDSVQVTIEGLKEDLDQLDLNALGAEMDVSGMEAGTHVGELTFQLGAAYEVTTYERPQIVVTETAAASTEHTSETQEKEASLETSQEETSPAEETES